MCSRTVFPCIKQIDDILGPISLALCLLFLVQGRVAFTASSLAVYRDTVYQRDLHHRLSSPLMIVEWKKWWWRPSPLQFYLCGRKLASIHGSWPDCNETADFRSTALVLVSWLLPICQLMLFLSAVCFVIAPSLPHSCNVSKQLTATLCTSCQPSLILLDKFWADLN